MPTMFASRTVIVPRSHGLSPGAIAGVVIGSLVGGSTLLIVLGFLYFRYRRRCRIAQAEEALPVSQVSDPSHAASSTWPDGSPQTGSLHREHTTSVKDGRADGAVPALPRNTTTARSRGEDWMGYEAYSNEEAGYDTLPSDVNFSLPPRQPTFPVTAEQATAANHASAALEAANSSYYDPRISMGSAPDQDIVLPSAEFDEMYKAQLREAEEHRRSSSLPKRIWNTITRQSTRNSKGTVGSGAQSPSSFQQQTGDSAQAHSVPVKQEANQEAQGQVPWTGISSQYVEEPEQMTDGASTVGLGTGQVNEHQSQPQHAQHMQYGRQTQDSQYGGFPGRIDLTVRETTEKDPALPSSVLHTDSTYGLPHAQPQSPTEQRERLKSPEIPEPMDLDGLQLETDGHSPLGSSQSPQLSPDSFTINPMAILHPTNPTEQAAYTTYQIKHSASPPAMPPPAPEIITRQPTQEDVVAPPPDRENDFADMYLDLPSDDEYRRSMDSYEYAYSSTPGQSSTAESNGRTPDTRPTASPSPFPTIPENGRLKPDPSVSPHSSRPSPPSGPLVCSECGREFDQIHKLNHHKRYHDRTHECPYADCDRKFGTKTHLDRHINDRHLKLKAYHCTEPTCAWFKGGKSFPRKDNWRRHMIKKHGSTPQDFENMELSFG